MLQGASRSVQRTMWACSPITSGRDYVVPEDVKSVAVPALGHRLSLRPELWVRGMRGDEVVQACLDTVPAPATQARQAG